jgi:hypothetical protein
MARNYNMETKQMYIMAMATVFHEEIPWIKS